MFAQLLEILKIWLSLAHQWERDLPDTKRRIFLPALSIDTAAIATEKRRTKPTRAASYSGFCNGKSGGEA